MDSAKIELPTGLPCTLNAAEWDYLAEGNQHMIFKYTGDIPNFIGTVIRCRKVMDPLPEKLEKEEIVMENYLQERYIKELVNEYCFKPHPVIGDMTKINILDVKNKGEFLDELLKRNESLRPEFRRKKTVDPDTHFELIFDYTFSLEKFSTHTHRYATIALEIKPKSAQHDEISLEEFKKIYEKVSTEKNISSSPEEIEQLYREYVSGEAYQKRCANGDKDRIKFTRFFKTQLKKQQDKKVQGFTSFDPHDFFDNGVSSVKKSIQQLLETPQNNLKLFIDGKEIGHDKQKKVLNEVVEHFLEAQHLEDKSTDGPGDLLDKFMELVARLLKNTGIVEVIKKFQDVYIGSSLGMVDLMTNLEKQFLEGKYELSPEKLKEIVERVANTEPKPYDAKNGATSVESLIEILVRFLISIAFRDCSVFISLQFLPHEEKEDLQFAEVLKEKGFKTFDGEKTKYKIMYTAGLIDFHMKGIQSAYSHPESTKELFGLLIQHLNEIKINQPKNSEK